MMFFQICKQWGQKLNLSEYGSFQHKNTQHRVMLLTTDLLAFKLEMTKC